MTTDEERKEIKKAIREKYREVSRSAEGMFRYPTGRAGAEALGYEPDLIRSAPDELLESFCGVGNPFSLGKIEVGETVLDVGCGAGFDLYCSSKMSGPGGKVFGIDLTPEMVEKARRALTQAGIGNAEVRLAGSEQIPFDDVAFDVVTSNGAINLSPEKERTFAEIYRILKPGGRLLLADMVLKKELPRREMTAKAWSH